MKKRNKWILIIIAVLIIGVVVASVFLRPEKKLEYSTEKVYQDELKRTISVTGTAKPKRVVNLAFERSGIVDEINVEIGDEIQRGDLLLSLDASQETLQVEQAQANLNLAESNLEMAQAHDLQTAKNDYNKAKQAYLNTKEANQRALEEARIDWEEAKDYTQDYQEYFDEVNSEYEGDDVTKMTRDLARANLTKAQTQERKTKEAYDTLEVTTQQEEDAAWYAKEQARLALEKQKALAYDWSKSNLLHLQDYNRIALDLARLNLNKKSIRTPIDGIVSKIDVEEGEGIVAYTPFITLVSKDIKIEARVPEVDIVAVKKGQKVDITFDAIDEQEFRGEVLEVEPTETIVEGVTYYKIKVIFEDPESLVKPGMSADININIYSKEQVLIAPQRAIKEKDDQKYVQVKEGEEIREVEVVTGLKGDGGTIEIIEGLEEGDEVVTFVKD